MAPDRMHDLSPSAYYYTLKKYNEDPCECGDKLKKRWINQLVGDICGRCGRWIQ